MVTCILKLICVQLEIERNWLWKWGEQAIQYEINYVPCGWTRKERHWQRLGSRRVGCMYWRACPTCWKAWDPLGVDYSDLKRLPAKILLLLLLLMQTYVVMNKLENYSAFVLFENFVQSNFDSISQPLQVIRTIVVFGTLLWLSFLQRDESGPCSLHLTCIPNLGKSQPLLLFMRVSDSLWVAAFFFDAITEDPRATFKFVWNHQTFHCACALFEIFFQSNFEAHANHFRLFKPL